MSLISQLPLALLMAKAAFAGSPQVVDLCDLTRHPHAWNGREVRVSGIATAGAEDLALEKQGGSCEAPSIVELEGAGSTWDQESYRELGEALDSYDPVGQYVSATMVGVFAAPDRLQVRTAVEVRVVPRTIPLTDTEREGAKRLIDRRARILWKMLIEALRGAEARQYFNEKVQGTLIPGGAYAVQFIPGEVVSVRPSDGEVAVAVLVSPVSGSPRRPPEVYLRLGGWRESDIAMLKPGTTVGFRGVALTFTTSPLSIEFEVHQGDVVIEKH